MSPDNPAPSTTLSILHVLGAAGSEVREEYVAELGTDAPIPQTFVSLADRTPLSSVMTREVVCVTPEVRIEVVAKLLEEQRISGVPVVDQHARPVGVLSRTDLVAHGCHPSKAALVRDIMMPVAFALPEGAALSHAIALMAAEGIHRVPVVGADGAVVGIVSTMDVVRWLARTGGHAVPA